MIILHYHQGFDTVYQRAFYARYLRGKYIKQREDSHLISSRPTFYPQADDQQSGQQQQHGGFHPSRWLPAGIKNAMHSVAKWVGDHQPDMWPFNGDEEARVPEMLNIFRNGLKNAYEKTEPARAYARKLGTSAKEVAVELIKALREFLSMMFPKLKTLLRGWFSIVINVVINFVIDQIKNELNASFERHRTRIIGMILLLANVFMAYLASKGWYKTAVSFSWILTAILVWSKCYFQGTVQAVVSLILGKLDNDPRHEDTVFYYQGPSSRPQDLKRLFKNVLTCAALLKCETAGLSLTDTSPANLERIMKRTVLVGRALQTWDMLLERFADILDDTLSIVCKWVYKVDYVSTRHVAEIDQWCEEVMDVLSLRSQLDVGRDRKTSFKIESLYRRYMVLRTKYTGNRQVIQQLDTFGMPITAMYNKVVNKNPHANVMRKEPVCVVFKGKAGVGKSFLMEPFKQDALKIADRFDSVANVEGQVYARCKEQEFWDGYTGQAIVIFDDFGQQVDTTSNPNPEWFELIRAVNIFPYALHSAALHEKANNPFNAEFVVLTTNVDVTVKPPSISSEEAVIRRLHNVFDVTIIPEVRKVGGIGVDIDRLRDYQRQRGLPAHDTSHWLFRRETYGKTCVENMTYAEMLADVANTYRNHHDSYEQRQINAENTKNNRLPPGVWSKNEDWMADAEQEPLWWDEYAPSSSGESDVFEYQAPLARAVPYEWWIRQPEALQRYCVQYGVTVWYSDYDLTPYDDVQECESIEDLTTHMIRLGMDPDIVPEHSVILERKALLIDLARCRRLRDVSKEEYMDAQHVKNMYTYYRREARRNPCWQNTTRAALAKAWVTAKAVSQGIWYRDLVKWVSIVGSIVMAVWGAYKLAKDYMNPRCGRHISSYRAYARWLYWSAMGEGPATGTVLLTKAAGIVATMALKHAKFHELYPVNLCDMCTTVHNNLQEQWDAFITSQSEEVDPEATPLPETPVEKNYPGGFTEEQMASYYFEDSKKGLMKMHLAKIEPGMEEHEKIPLTVTAEKKDSDDPESIRSRKVIVEVEKKDSDDPESIRSRKVIVEVEGSPNLQKLLNPESERGFVENKRRRVHAEGPASEQAQELAYCLKRNQMFLFAEGSDTTGVEKSVTAYLGQIFVLKGRLALVNKHFLASLDAVYARISQAFEHPEFVNVRFFFRIPQIVTRFYMEIDEFMESQRELTRLGSKGEVLATEFNLFDLPIRVPARKDISGHFIMKKDLMQITRGTRMLLPTYFPKENDDACIIRDGMFQSTTDIDLAPIGNQATKRTFLESGIVNISSAKGDCGAPYILADNKFPRKLCGVHFGGDAGRGSFSFITQEDLRPHLAGEIYAAQSALTSYSREDEETFPLNKEFELVGKIPKAEFQPRDTDKQQSVIANMVVPTGVRPSWKEEPLSPDGPMIKGVRKYVGHNQTVNRRILDEAIHSYKQIVLTLPLKAEDRRVLTFEEACAGIPGDDAYVALKRKASAGYPYKNEKGAIGKNIWLGSGEKWDFTTDGAQRLRNDVKEIIKRAEYGEIPEILFIDTLKDECRPFEKVLAKKTRVFSAAPLHFSVVVRMYFAGWCAHKKRNFVDAESCVGIDAKSGGVKKHWSKLARYLQRYGEKSLIAGDFGNFDGTLVHDIHWAVLDIIEDYYQGSPKERQVRRVLWEAMIHSEHILHDYVYQLAHGQPSGNALTVDVNSDYVSLLVRYVIGTIVGSCHQFNNNCRLVNYGDDHILAVSPYWQTLFTPRTFGAAINALGMQYTSESKAEQGDEYRNLEEVTFLKRGFVWCPKAQMWMAPLAMESILEMTNWITKSTSPIEATLRNCEDAIIELYFHDQETCEEWTSKIRSVIREELDMDLPAIPWKTARSMISAGTLGKAYPLEMSHC